jgi:hypothetical protein
MDLKMSKCFKEYHKSRNKKGIALARLVFGAIE